MANNSSSWSNSSEDSCGTVDRFVSFAIGEVAANFDELIEAEPDRVELLPVALELPPDLATSLPGSSTSFVWRIGGLACAVTAIDELVVGRECVGGIFVLSDGLVGSGVFREGFDGTGTERLIRSKSSPPVIATFRLEARIVPSAFVT